MRERSDDLVGTLLYRFCFLLCGRSCSRLLFSSDLLVLLPSLFEKKERISKRVQVVLENLLFEQL